MTDQHSDLIREALSRRLGTSNDWLSIVEGVETLESDKRDALESAETYRNQFFKARRQLRQLEEFVGTLEAADDEPPREPMVDDSEAIDCPYCDRLLATGTACVCESL